MSDTPTLNGVLVTLGGGACVIPAMQVATFASWSVAACAGLGVGRLADGAKPVLMLDGLLYPDATPPPTYDARALVVRGGRLFGVAVARIVGVQRLALAEIVAVPPMLLPRGGRAVTWAFWLPPNTPPVPIIDVRAALGGLDPAIVADGGDV